MTGLAAYELQKAVYTALTGNAPLMAKITGVFDEPDESAPFPFVVIGDGTAVESSTKTEDCQNITLVLHVWSDARGRMEVKDIMGLVFDALEGASLSLSSHVLILLRFEMAEDFRDVQGGPPVYRGVMRFRALTQKL